MTSQPNGPTRTVVELRDYVDEILERMDRHYDTRFAALAEALRVALAANEKRLDALNELRAVVNDQQKTFATRESTDMRFRQFEMSIRSLEESRAEARGKASQTSVLVGYGIAAIGILLGVIGLLT